MSAQYFESRFNHAWSSYHPFSVVDHLLGNHALCGFCPGLICVEIRNTQSLFWKGIVIKMWGFCAGPYAFLLFICVWATCLAWERQKRIWLILWAQLLSFPFDILLFLRLVGMFFSGFLWKSFSGKNVFFLGKCLINMNRNPTQSNPQWFLSCNFSLFLTFHCTCF